MSIIFIPVIIQDAPNLDIITLFLLLFCGCW